MPMPADRDEVRRLLAERAQLVEVLPVAEYEDEHLPGDIPTCRPHDRLHEVYERLDASGCDTCFVVDERRAVLGGLGRRAIRRCDDVTAERAMTLGPSTIRPSVRLRDVVERMQRTPDPGVARWRRARTAC